MNAAWLLRMGRCITMVRKSPATALRQHRASSPPAPLPSARTAPGSPTAGTSPRTSAKSSAPPATSAPPTPTPPMAQSPPLAMSPSPSNGAASTTMQSSKEELTKIKYAINDSVIKKLEIKNILPMRNTCRLGDLVFTLMMWKLNGIKTRIRGQL